MEGRDPALDAASSFEGELPGGSALDAIDSAHAVTFTNVLLASLPSLSSTMRTRSNGTRLATLSAVASTGCAVAKRGAKATDAGIRALGPVSSRPQLIRLANTVRAPRNAARRDGTERIIRSGDQGEHGLRISAN